MGILALALVAAAAFVAWASNAQQVVTSDLAAVRENPAVEVVAGQGYVAVLPPGDGDPPRGVVFYPGARVAPEAYVPTWAPIVEEAGAAVYIASMPLNLASLDRDRAAAVIEANPGITEWWVGGHALGGAVAARYARLAPRGQLEGVLLWGARTDEGASLRERSDLAVLSLSGTRDGPSSAEEISDGRSFLPPGAVLVEIAGMNHAQFGRYGWQRGDLESEISDDKAAALLTAAVVEFWDGHTRQGDETTTPAR